MNSENRDNEKQKSGMVGDATSINPKARDTTNGNQELMTGPPPHTVAGSEAYMTESFPKNLADISVPLARIDGDLSQRNKTWKRLATTEKKLANKENLPHHEEVSKRKLISYLLEAIYS
ncbi:hypothetical protein SESBI_07940 [Sesbania bispinosa]|nr:hypothetical protein SESBI_07940 [Sesbania bispinosa]